MYNNLQNPNKGGRCTFAVSGNSEFQPSAEAQFDAEITQSVLKPFKAVPTPNNTGEGAALSYPTMQNDNAAEGLRTIIEEMQTPIEQLNNETMKNSEQPKANESYIGNYSREYLLQEIARKIQESKIKSRPQNFLFQWDGINFAPRGRVISLKAQPKAGKTFALTAFCIAFLSGNNGGLLSHAEPHERLLYVDTEQHIDDTREIRERLEKELPDASERYHVINVSDDKEDCRLSLIKAYVEEYKPTLIVIDGIADLIPGMDYNDQAQAVNIISDIKRLAKESNAVVFNAIHVNKNDEYACGWLGKTLSQKCDIELMVVREKNSKIRELKPTIVRKFEFPSISFEIVNTEDDLGKARIIPLDEAQDIADSKRRQIDRQNIIDLGIFPNQSFTKKALNELIVAAKSKQGITYTDKAAYAQITRWIKSGALKVGDNDYILFEE